MDKSSQDLLYKDHLSADMSIKQCYDACAFCWKEPFGFITLDLEQPINKGKLRRGLHDFLEFNMK